MRVETAGSHHPRQSVVSIISAPSSVHPGLQPVATWDHQRHRSRALLLLLSMADLVIRPTLRQRRRGAIRGVLPSRRLPVHTCIRASRPKNRPRQRATRRRDGRTKPADAGTGSTGGGRAPGTFEIHIARVASALFQEPVGRSFPVLRGDLERTEANGCLYQAVDQVHEEFGAPLAQQGGLEQSNRPIQEGGRERQRNHGP